MSKLQFTFNRSKFIQALVFFSKNGVTDLTKLKAAKLLYFAHATSRQIVAGVYIEGEVVRDRFARAIVEGRAACSLDGNITLKMTADAN